MPLVLVTLVFAKIYFASRESGLSQFPGPWFARYTDLWRAYQAYSSMSKSNYDYEALRQNYGDVVRIGPSIVLVFDPEAVPTIFGTGSRLDKVCLPFTDPLEFGLLSHEPLPGLT